MNEASMLNPELYRSSTLIWKKWYVDDVGQILRGHVDELREWAHQYTARHTHRRYGTDCDPSEERIEVHSRALISRLTEWPSDLQGPGTPAECSRNGAGRR